MSRRSLGEGGLQNPLKNQLQIWRNSYMTHHLFLTSKELLAQLTKAPAAPERRSINQKNKKMQNKPNFKIDVANTTPYIARRYKNLRLYRHAKTNPIQTQFKANSKPFLTSQPPIKAKTNPIQTQSNPILPVVALAKTGQTQSPHLLISKFSPSALSCALFPSSNPISSSLK